MSEFLIPPPLPTHDSDKARYTREVYGATYMYCLRCGYPEVYTLRFFHWHQLNTHISYGPLCQDCWEDLAHPEARIEYYHTMFEWWVAAGVKFLEEFGIDVVRADITRAVANSE